MKDDFLDVRFDEPKLDNSKVILINAPCTKSALMNPMEFLFHEGEGNYGIMPTAPDRLVTTESYF